MIVALLPLLALLLKRVDQLQVFITAEYQHVNEILVGEAGFFWRAEAAQPC